MKEFTYDIIYGSQALLLYITGMTLEGRIIRAITIDNNQNILILE